MTKGKAVASLVLGILSILFSITGIIGLILGIIAIVFGAKNMKQESEGRGMAIAGFVMGIVGTLFSLFWTLLWLMIIFAAISLIQSASPYAGNITNPTIRFVLPIL
jgi:hypothetical protein